MIYYYKSFFSNQFSVFFYTFEREYYPVVYFYKLIPLGGKGSGARMKDLVIAQLKKDNLWDYMKRNIGKYLD